MIKKYGKYLLTFILCLVIIRGMTSELEAAYKHPSALWQHFDKWSAALESNDYDAILELAPKIEALYSGEALNTTNCEMLSNVCGFAARASEVKGKLEHAVEWLNKQLIYDNYLNENGYDYYDRIIMTEGLIRQLDVGVEIYTAANEPADVPYYGVLGEPKIGVLHGSTGNSITDMSATLIYVEFEPASRQNMEYWLTYYSKNKNMLQSGEIVELAWNFPKEGNQLRDIISGENDEYIISSIKALSVINNTVLLRIGGEMNVWTVMPDEELYINAFRKIANYARDYADNIAIVFSPNDISYWGKSYLDYYPGDEYLDWIGVSTYYTGKEATGDYSTDAFYSLGEYSNNPLVRIRLLTETFHNKPIIISECGFAYNSSVRGDQTKDAADRMKKFYSYIAMKYPQVKAILNFDANTKEADNSYQLSGNQTMLSEYKILVGGETFLSSPKHTAKGYTRLATLNEKTETLKLYTYAVFPSLESTACSYYVDDFLVKTTNAVPFLCEISVVDLSVGLHVVRSEITCGRISKSVIRQFYVLEDGTVKGVEA